MRTSAIVVAVVAACAAVVAVSANCVPSQCQFSLKDASGTSHAFDLSSMCTGADYTMNVKDFKYVANVCGNAVADCLPASFTQPPTNGVAVQFFGSVPSCSKPTCTNPSTGTPECCTAECHVLGTGAPTWSFTDASNPSTGGLEATFTPVKVDIDNDPFWCPAESNGSMEPRSVTYHFLCDPSKTPGVISGVEAPKMDNYCTVHVNFTTSLACASS